MCSVMEKKIQSRRYYPLLVDESGLENQVSDQEDQKIWEAYDRLDLNKKKVLTSFEVPIAIKSMEDILSLSNEEVGVASLAVRKIFFEEWTIDTCREKIASLLVHFGKTDNQKLTAIVEYIKSDILTIVPKEEVDDEKKSAIKVDASVRVALLEALSRFPQLGQQTITESRVKLKTSAEPMRGSLLNWIKCYREELGVGYHDSVTRGQFLFRSQNGAKLSDEERERIALILRSIEDSELLVVDADRQEILFPVAAPRPQHGLVGAPERMPQFDTREAVMSAPQPLPANITAAAPAAPVPQKEVPFERDNFVIAPHARALNDHNVVRQVNPEEFASLGLTGSMHVATKPVAAPVSPSNGTLHFSSKHVLPAEKDLLVQNEAEQLAAPVPTTPKPSAMQAPLQPPQAPKRNPSYIPNPFRIDPVSNDRLEEE